MYLRIQFDKEVFHFMSSRQTTTKRRMRSGNMYPRAQVTEMCAPTTTREELGEDFMKPYATVALRDDPECPCGTAATDDRTPDKVVGE